MSRRTYLITVSILTCLCIYLGLKGLDNAMFWDDEAQVAVIAKNYLKTGELSGWDGRNLYAYRNGGLLDQNLNLKIQPLDILITAGSFKLFGISTWSARFPFAVLGLLCLGVMFLMLRREFDTEYELQLFIFTCFAFSCTFLLNIRQARYYSPVLLFSMLTYLAYQYYRSDHRYFWYLAMGILSILSFYANPMLCGAFLLSMAGYHGLFRRQKMDFQEWYGLASAIAIFLAAIVPYAILQQIWIRPDQEYVVKEIWWVRKLHLIQWNFRDLNSINLLPWLLVPIIIYFVVKPNKHENVLLRIRGWGFLGLINVLLIALISPQATGVLTWSNVRYLFVSVPFIIGVVGWMLWMIYQQNRWLSFAVTGIYLCTNLLSLGLMPSSLRGANEFKWLLPAYIREIHQPYPTSYSTVIDYLKQHARQDDKVFTFPEYYNYPLMFYVGDKYYFTSMLDEGTHLNKDKILKLSDRFFMNRSYPDWILLFGVQQVSQEYVDYFSRPHQANGEWEKFQYANVTIANVCWDQTQRPEIIHHGFGPQPVNTYPMDAVLIFKREPDPAGLTLFLQKATAVKKP